MTRLAKAWTLARPAAAVLAAALASTPMAGRAAFFDAGSVVLGANYDSRSASLADIDNDGDLDLFFQGALGAQQVFRNNLVETGSLGFSNVTSTWLPAGVGASWSAAWADVNGDGRVDVFVGQSNTGSSDAGDFLLNTGRGFVNQSVPAGLNDPGFHQNVAWIDIDRDHDLDLLIGMEGPEKHQVYLQGPGGTFTAVGAQVGFQQSYGTKAYGMAIGDTDNDGDLDVYISTCIGSGTLRNNFYENQLAQTGQLSFVDIADTNGTQNLANSYGTQFLDLDDDGDLDLFLVGADRQPSKIFRNDGGNHFTDVDTITGHPLISNVGGDLNGAVAVDYDNDGDLDLFFHDHLSAGGSNSARRLYRNDGNWTFTDVTSAMGLSEANRGSYDSPWGDIDRDGDMDLIATTDFLTSERVYLNDASTNGAHWLQVELNGPSWNTTGLGATVYATTHKGSASEKTIRREANTNADTFNQSDLPVHLGLGAAGVVDELRIVWPDGRVQVLSGVAPDRYLTVNYASILTGDYNGDGRVDSADYTVWRDELGRRGFGNAADGDGDGDVDNDDFLAWRDHYGQAAASLSTAIPEPSAAAAAALALAVAGLRRAR